MKGVVLLFTGLKTNDEEEGRMTQFPKDRRSRIKVRWIRIDDIWGGNLIYDVDVVNVTSSRKFKMEQQRTKRERASHPTSRDRLKTIDPRSSSLSLAIERSDRTLIEEESCNDNRW